MNTKPKLRIVAWNMRTTPKIAALLRQLPQRTQTAAVEIAILRLFHDLTVEEIVTLVKEAYKK